MPRCNFPDLVQKKVDDQKTNLKVNSFKAVEYLSKIMRLEPKQKAI